MNNEHNLILKEAKNSEIIFDDMQKQFPPEELKDFETFKKLLNTSDYRLFVLDDNSKLTGYLIFLEDKLSKTIWIDYVAILKEYHGCGYGSEIFHIAKNTFKELKGCYLEVEKPNPDDINTLRRIKFYTRLGARKLNVDYIYPNKTGGLPMDLYFMPFDEAYFPSKKDMTTAIRHTFSFLHSDIENTEEIFAKIS